MKILIVEDNEMNRDMLQRRLQRKGFEVEVAIDGLQGVEAAQKGSFDLVLMDISLPGIDGFEARKRLKASAATKTLPVIALTAHAMTGDESTILASGFDDYDTKPVDLPRLLGKIEKLAKK